MTLKALSLCSGIGALDLAIQSIGVQTIGYCEYDEWCGEVLQHRMASGHLDSAPIWRDLNSLDGYSIPVGVDLIYGGIPCQPHSQAGKRLQAGDSRDLWPATRRLLHELQPRLFLLENVAGFSTRNGTNPAFAYSVISDLAAMGYVGQAGIVKASDAGAPHSRARWFCLATLDGDVRLADSRRNERRGRSTIRKAGGGDESPSAAHETGDGRRPSVGGFGQINESSDGSSSDDKLADATQQRLEGERVSPAVTERARLVSGGLADTGRMERLKGRRDSALAQQLQEGEPDSSQYFSQDEELDNTDSGGREPAHGQIRTGRDSFEFTGTVDNTDSNRWLEGRSGYGSSDESAHSAIERDGFTSNRFPPNRIDYAAWAAILQQHPEYAPAIERGVRGVADGRALFLDKDRRRQLAALGNAVVPAQVLVALEHLLEVR